MLTGAQAFDLLSLWPIGNVVAMEPFHTEDYHFSGNIVFVQTLNEKYVLKRTKAGDWPEWRYCKPLVPQIFHDIFQLQRQQLRAGRSACFCIPAARLVVSG